MKLPLMPLLLVAALLAGCGAEVAGTAATAAAVSATSARQAQAQQAQVQSQLDAALQAGAARAASAAD